MCKYARNYRLGTFNVVSDNHPTDLDIPTRVTQPSIFDVIDNFWGDKPIRRIQTAHKSVLRRFGQEVNRFYEAYVPLEKQDKELRTYFGGLVSTNFASRGKQQTFFNNLLYSHSVVVPDPIARWYFDRYDELPKIPPVQYPGQAPLGLFGVAWAGISKTLRILVRPDGNPVMPTIAEDALVKKLSTQKKKLDKLSEL